MRNLVSIIGTKEPGHVIHVLDYVKEYGPSGELILSVKDDRGETVYNGYGTTLAGAITALKSGGYEIGLGKPKADVALITRRTSRRQLGKIPDRGWVIRSLVYEVEYSEKEKRFHLSVRSGLGEAAEWWRSSKSLKELEQELYAAHYEVVHGVMLANSDREHLWKTYFVPPKVI